MSAKSSTIRIGYLPFYVDYYESICPDFPREKAEIAARCAKMLEQFGEVIWDGNLVGDANSAAVSGRELANRDLDCVVIFTTIAVFGGISLAALRDLHVPILIWNPQLIDRVGKGYNMEEIVRNTSQIGSQALANTLLREGRPFRVVTGYEKSDRMKKDLERYFAIIGTVAALRRARLLAIGEIFPAMTDILIDAENLERQVGATIVNVNNEELTRRYLNVDEETVKRGVERMRNDFSVSNLSDDEAVRSVRLCEAFHSLVTEHQADAGTLNCHAGVCLRNPEIGITACYGHGIQNALGRPFTCTGDLPTAIAMLLLKRLAGMAMYTEVQVMDEQREAIVIANSGEGEDCIRRKGASAVVTGNNNFTGLHGRGASFAYPLQPGLCTMLSFTPTQGSYRLIAAEGEILEDPLPDAGALAGFFKFSHTDLHTGYTRWLEAGVVHHAATALGHWNREIKEVSELMGFEMVEI